MKTLKLSSILIIILTLIVGITIFTLSRTNLNSLETPANKTSDLSTETSKTEDKPDNEVNTSAAATSDVAESETVSVVANTSETESSVLDLNSTFLSCHTEPSDVDAESGATSKASIYGKNLSVIPTGVLVNKALVSGKNQTAELMGIVIDFKPMIIVIGSNKETKVTFDLKAFNYAEGEYKIVNTATQETAASFIGRKGVQEVQFNAQKSGGYAIIKDNYTLGIIEVVDNLDSADLEVVRKKYIN